MSQTVKNYYALPEVELEEAIQSIREWLFTYYGHPQTPRVSFALEVALCAKDTYALRQNDQFVQTVLDILIKE